MHLVKLKIDNLPGIVPGYEFEAASNGINLVTGPNAIGKSSLARALKYLLADKQQKNDPKDLSLAAEFAGGEDRWQVRRNGSQILWTRNGEPASSPNLPTADQSGLYRLAMEHLLTDDKNDKDLADTLQSQLRGGFNLNTLRIAPSPRRGLNEEKALRGANGKLQEKEGEYAQLRRQETELPALEQRIASAKEAQQRAELLAQAIELQKAVDQHQAAAQALAQFPSGMQRLRGDDIEQLERLEQKERERRDELRELQRQLTDNQAALERTGLSEQRPTPEALQATQKRIQAIETKEVKRESARAARTQAHADLRDASSQLNDTAAAPERDDTARTPRLNEDTLQRSEELASQFISEKKKQLELTQRLELAGTIPDPAEMNRLRQGDDALRTWLAANALATQEMPAWRNALPYWIALGAAVITALVTVIQNAWATTIGTIAIVAAVLWTWAVRRQSVFGNRKQSEDAKSRFQETGLAVPPEWSTASVRNYLDEEIEPQLDALSLQRGQAADAPYLRDEIAGTEKKIAGLEARKSALAERVGFDPKLPMIYFDRFLRLCINWDRARQESERQAAELKQIESEIRAVAAEVSQFLAQWTEADAPPQADAFAAATEGEAANLDLLVASFDVLKGRVEKASNTQTQVTHTQGRINTANQQIEEVKEDIANFLRGLELEPGARAELDRRVKQIDAWNKTREVRDKAKNDEERIRGDLAVHPDLINMVDEGATDALNDRLEDATLRADGLPNLHKERTQIHTRLEDAGKDQALEQAMAAQAQAREALVDKRDEALLHTATELLLDDVDQAFQAEHEPPILKRGRELFAEVTNRSFDLEINKDGAFQARDCSQGTIRSLGELSSGTRMQLLLALRLAWIEAQEQGTEPMPLFLDEALTTSDEDRFKVMAESLERLAEAEKRQIFYLSARRHERALWRQMTGNEPPTIDLAAVRFGARVQDAKDYSVETRPRVPAPDGRRAGDYAAQVGVPPINPHLSPQGIHPFHLLRDDLGLLHQLMDNWCIVSLGQLEQLLKSSAAKSTVADASRQQQLRLRCRAAGTWVELWRQGRGRPVDRSVLEQSGAVSHTFLDDASNLATTLQGDGPALLQALEQGRLPRFQDRKLQELEQWLVEHEYIDKLSPLDRDERRRLTLRQAESAASAKDLNELVSWLEAGLNQTYETSD